MSDVTCILQSIDNGEQRAADELLPAVYNELHKLAPGKNLPQRTFVPGPRKTHSCGEQS